MTRHNDQLPDDVLPSVLGGAVPSGLYWWAPAGSREAVTSALVQARKAGWHGAVLELSQVSGKSSFLDRCARDLELPDWFGGNWDALADCLTDLSWWGEPRGCLLIPSGWEDLERTAPDTARIATDVLRDAAVSWRTRSRALTVLAG